MAGTAMDVDDGSGGGRADQVHFELARYERVTDGVRVTVHGMTRMTDVDLLVQERRDTLRLSPIADGVVGPLRAFEIVVDLEVDDGNVIEFEGHGSLESVAVADVPADMAVVCGPDPAVNPPAGEFLHKRGDRLVLTSLTDVESAGRSVDRTTLVA